MIYVWYIIFSVKLGKTKNTRRAQTSAKASLNNVKQFRQDNPDDVQENLHVMTKQGIVRLEFKITKPSIYTERKYINH